MASKSKHYTSVEKKILLDILKQFKDTIEAKRSDSSTLREKAAAWTEIGRKYNASFQITEERTVAQLKKLWTNLKQAQRNALTKEKQAAMATGGGPPEATVEVDPDIAMIVPHLMTVAPTKFSSNILPGHGNDEEGVEEAEDEDEDDMETEYLDMALLQEANVPTNAVKCNASLPGTSSSSAEATSEGTPGPVRKKLCVTPKQSRSDRKIQNDTLKMQRVADLRSLDEELHQIRKDHERKVATMRECHLNVMNHMREKHLAKIQELELRKATAEAELAELKLLRETESI